MELLKFESADFKYNISFFKNSSLKISKYSIFGQQYSNKAFLFLHKILDLGKFEGAPIKPQKYLNYTFLVSNSDIFFREISNQTYLRVVISNMRIVFSNYQIFSKYQNKAFLVPSLRIFILHQTLQPDKF